MDGSVYLYFARGSYQNVCHLFLVSLQLKETKDYPAGMHRNVYLRICKKRPQQAWNWQSLINDKYVVID